jgi:hypothetical protein
MWRGGGADDFQREPVTRITQQALSHASICATVREGHPTLRAAGSHSENVFLFATFLPPPQG